MSYSYWHGPYNVRVPDTLISVTSEDGVNWVSRCGMRTQMQIPNPPTEEQYKQRYCKLVDGIWWYRTD